ncbi:MAG TPA: protein kinase [Polyangiaceae bacterium]|nr:protein kinase [Polyangiaceae bacterium]
MSLPAKPEGPGLVAGAIIAKRYRLDRLLGRGGMGVVWAATHTVTQRTVAVKFLRADSAHANQELRQRFLREARTASAVSHPNVVTISDVFELEDDTPVMVMDLLAGETLGQKLLREKKLSLAQTAAILVQVVSAVGAAHALGIVHRDLKPDNIFVLEGVALGDAVRVLDFGIAKVLEPDTLSDSTGVVTKTGSILGTPCYMSPEQAIGESDIDHRSDIWSIGVILYECLTGVRPIQGDSIGQIVKQILVDGVRPIDELEPDLPRAIVELVADMLSRERDGRPSHLERVLELLSAQTEVVVPAFGLPERDPARSRESLGNLETLRADPSARAPAGAELDPPIDTQGAQSLPNALPGNARRWVLPLAAGVGLLLAGTAALRGRTAALKDAERTPGASASSADTSPAAQPAVDSAPPLTPPLATASAAAPVAAASAGASGAWQSGVRSGASRASTAGVRARPAPASSPLERPVASATLAPPQPSAAPSSRTFPRGLSEQVPF